MSGLVPSHAAGRGSADERLAQAVAAAVRSRCGRSLANFAVATHEGVATLRGVVRGYYQKQVMLKAAQAVPGVAQVIDHVEVLPLEPRIHLDASARAEAHSAA
jgi:osmotically-inducible protein OsmY